MAAGDVMSMLSDFVASSKVAARDFAAGVNPLLDVEQRATKGWWLTELHEALAVVAVYLVIVIVGKILYQAPKARAASAKPEGVPTWSEVGQRLAAKPVMSAVKLAYNITQVVLCLWMVVYSIMNAQAAGYIDYYLEKGTICIPTSKMPSLDNSQRTDAENNLAFVLWVFYLSKVLDFMDTLFIVIEGKWQQFTFLHVFHHFSIFSVYWVNIYTGYDGDIWFTIVANGTIHAIMYYYYTLTTLGARPWWKSLLTYAQMAQFIAMMVQGAYLYSNPDCGFPKPIAAAYFFYIMLLFVLFARFAAGAYCSKPSRKVKDE